ncbi:TonB-dependent receptor domain-containing protein [Granulicella sp. L56]|uniref:TonB-dependent receptor domain-containing protein n=1 Tax=Granulicella sp. L56 TaxID=1747222 RepID=UPI00352D0D20
MGSLSRWPLNQLRAGYQYSDAANWTFGSHNLSLGGDLRQQYTDQSQTFQTDASLTFNGTFTKNSLADFLVGRMSKITQQSYNGGKPAATTPDLFAEDDWKISPRLTLNLGLRWEPFVPLHDRLDRVSQYRAGQQSTALPNAPIGYVFPGDAGVPSNTYPGRWGVLAPRVGFALDVFGYGLTSLRGGFGIYNASIRSQALNNLSTNLPMRTRWLLARPLVVSQIRIAI